jgi:hypothetical protein
VIRAGCHFRQWWEPRNPRAGRAPCPSQLPLQSITTSLSRLVLRTRHLFRIQLVAADVCGWVDESGLDRWRERPVGKKRSGWRREKSRALFRMEPRGVVISGKALVRCRARVLSFVASGTAESWDPAVDVFPFLPGILSVN